MLDRLKLSFILMLAPARLDLPTLAGPQKSADNAVQADPPSKSRNESMTPEPSPRTRSFSTNS